MVRSKQYTWVRPIRLHLTHVIFIYCNVASAHRIPVISTYQISSLSDCRTIGFPSSEQQTMPRRTPQYSVEDCDVLNTFREEYRQKVDIQQRNTMLRSKIFPSMFNHWKTPPESLSEKEKSDRLKVSFLSSIQNFSLCITTGSEKLDHQQLETL
jgi:hypothetical protein